MTSFYHEFKLKIYTYIYQHNTNHSSICHKYVYNFSRQSTWENTTYQYIIVKFLGLVNDPNTNRISYIYELQNQCSYPSPILIDNATTLILCILPDETCPTTCNHSLPVSSALEGAAAGIIGVYVLLFIMWFGHKRSNESQHSEYIVDI